MEAATNGARIDTKSGNTSVNPGQGNGIGGNGATPGDGSVGGSEEDVIAKIEVKHLIEPKVDDSGPGGEYTRKLTLPKNYDGMLYLAGINLQTLSSKDIKVRFNFGKDKSPITIQGTVSTAPGLTNQSTIEVIVLNLHNTPFDNVNLIYDLYDYNSYDFTNSGTPVGALNQPVSHNRNEKLFCRGLNLEDDSTFSGALSQGCQGENDVCKYAYAKVVDKGLIRHSTDPQVPNHPILPLNAAIQVGNTGLYADSNATKLLRCLPDNPTLSGNFYTFSPSEVFATFGSTLGIDGINYTYLGPYSSIHYDAWGIKGAALKGEYGIFGGIWDDNTNGVIDPAEVEFGYKSKLFPLYIQRNLSSGIEYLGSNLPHEEKVIKKMVSNGDSLWMDGCNERVTTFQEDTSEHIGSCNVTASIEIIAKGDDDKEVIVDVSKTVKLQLVKPAKLDTNGENVLLSSFRSCNSTSECGSDSCCINKRCWSKTIVSQCVEDLPQYGQKVAGQTCASDHECASLCCKGNGKCGHHDPSATPPVLCEKDSTQKCISDEYCATKTITYYGIVKTNPDPQGNKTCAVRYVHVDKFGSCVPQNSAGTSYGICVPPTQPNPPSFNPSDPNRCDDAITYEELIQEANKNL